MELQLGIWGGCLRESPSCGSRLGMRSVRTTFVGIASFRSATLLGKPEQLILPGSVTYYVSPGGPGLEAH